MHWIDPASLPETRGKVSCFLLNPHGKIDGVVLDGKLQVHIPPHLSKKVAKLVAVGDRVRVRGVRPRTADVVAAVALTSKQGVEMIDEGPQDHDRPPKPEGKAMETEGNVVLSLFGPKGELRGALLDNGTSLRMPPHAATELADYLAPGARVQAWGRGIKNKFGRVLDVEEIAHSVDAD